jgi:CheY-like chemotaxis protein
MGLRILIVEDEMTIALLLEDMVTELGHDVAAVAMRLPDALQAAQVADADLAILDVNLDGHRSFAVADALRGRGIPFFFATGYGAAGIAPEYAATLVLKKPFLQRDLEDAIQRSRSLPG